MNPPVAENTSAVAHMLGGRSIVFLGMMGCGKSAIGKIVAQKLELPFKDADSEIELAAGRSVADIFREFGEEEFRRLEARVIERVLGDSPTLLALGGGAFMDEGTRKVVKDNAVSVWLQADIDLLLKRVARRPGKRPLLAEGDPRQILEDLMKTRNPVYRMADVHVQTTDGTKNQTGERVLERLFEYLSGKAGRTK